MKLFCYKKINYYDRQPHPPKKFVKELWPSIIFSFDSTHFFIKNGNDVHVYRIPEQQTLYVFNSAKVTSYFLSPRVNTTIVYSDSVGEGSLISVYLQQPQSLEKTCELGIQNVQEIKVL